MSSANFASLAQLDRAAEFYFAGSGFESSGGRHLPRREASLKLAGRGSVTAPAYFHDLVDLMDELEIEAAMERARREYGTERAPAARRALREIVAAQMERNVPRAAA